jgi:hypothetical protein
MNAQASRVKFSAVNGSRCGGTLVDVLEDSFYLLQRALMVRKRAGHASFMEVVMAKLTHGRKKSPGLDQFGPCGRSFRFPWITGFAAEDASAWNAWIAGILLGVLTIAALAMLAQWEGASLAIRLWLTVSPMLLWFAANVSAM